MIDDTGAVPYAVMTHRPTIERTIARLGRVPALDRAVERVGRAADALVAKPSRRELLEGAPLGHSVHPPLTDLPIGFWTSAFVLDFCGPSAARSADICVALGTMCAVPTAVTGLADWRLRTRSDQRIGVVHAACNGSATVLYLASMVLRARGSRRAAVGLSIAGATAATLGGALGGHLAFAPSPPDDVT